MPAMTSPTSADNKPTSRDHLIDQSTASSSSLWAEPPVRAAIHSSAAVPVDPTNRVACYNDIRPIMSPMTSRTNDVIGENGGHQWYSDSSIRRQCYWHYDNFDSRCWFGAEQQRVANAFPPTTHYAQQLQHYQLSPPPSFSGSYRQYQQSHYVANNAACDDVTSLSRRGGETVYAGYHSNSIADDFKDMSMPAHVTSFRALLASNSSDVMLHGQPTGYDVIVSGGNCAAAPAAAETERVINADWNTISEDEWKVIEAVSNSKRII